MSLDLPIYNDGDQLYNISVFHWLSRPSGRDVSMKYSFEIFRIVFYFWNISTFIKTKLNISAIIAELVTTSSEKF